MFERNSTRPSRSFRSALAGLAVTALALFIVSPAEAHGPHGHGHKRGLKHGHVQGHGHGHKHHAGRGHFAHAYAHGDRHRARHRHAHAGLHGPAHLLHLLIPHVNVHVGPSDHNREHGNGRDDHRG